MVKKHLHFLPGTLHCRTLKKSIGKGKNSSVMDTGAKVEITNSSSEERNGTGKLTISVMPNPTSYYFT